MVTGELKNKVDGLWEIFWTGGLTNPLDVIEQMTYLMFIRDLDDSDNVHMKESNGPKEEATFSAGFRPETECVFYPAFQNLRPFLPAVY